MAPFRRAVLIGLGLGRSGVVLGVVCLSLTAFMCNIAKDYLIEVMARAEAIEYPEEANEHHEDDDEG
jgi:hypothetical protein